MENGFVKKSTGFLGHSVTKLLGLMFVVALIVSLASMTVSADATVIESGKKDDYSYELYSDGELKVFVNYDSSDSELWVMLRDISELLTVKRITVDITGYDGRPLCVNGWDCDTTGISKISIVYEGECKDLFFCFQNFDVLDDDGIEFPEGTSFKYLGFYFSKNLDYLGCFSDYQIDELELYELDYSGKIDVSFINAKTLNVYDCDNLTEIILPDNSEIAYITDCSNITEVILPDHCEIAHIADCPNLKTCYIPEYFKIAEFWYWSVIEETKHCFDGCHSLADIYYAGSRTEFDEIKVLDFDGIDQGITFRELCGEAEIHYYYGQRSTWIQEGDSWVYLDQNGDFVTGWQEINGSWYYFNKDGIMQNGWLKDGGVWYYLKPNGAMATGWLEISGVWYYFGTNGKMKTGWQKVGGKDYFFKADGTMASDEYINGYYLDKNGTWTYKYRASWKSDSKGRYYQDMKGWYPKNQWLRIDNQWYFFKKDGYMAQSEYVNGYWFNVSGTWTYSYRASWRQDSKGWWYGDANGWYAKNCTMRIDGKNYDFDASGYCTNP